MVDGSCDSARGLIVLADTLDRPHSQKHFLTPLTTAENRKYLRLSWNSRLKECFRKNSMNVISRNTKAAGNSNSLTQQCTSPLQLSLSLSCSHCPLIEGNQTSHYHNFKRCTPHTKTQQALAAPHLQHCVNMSVSRSETEQSCTVYSACAAWGTFMTKLNLIPYSNKASVFLPTGAPKAAETPAAAPADTKSRFSVSLRKYSKIYKHKRNSVNPSESSHSAAPQNKNKNWWCFQPFCSRVLDQLLMSSKYQHMVA